MNRDYHSKDLQSRVAVISGGSRGIGFAIAEALAAEGFDLAIIGRRDEDHVQSLATLRKKSNEVLYCQGSIDRSEDIKRITTQIFDYFPRIHLLVNNAGIAPRERRDILHTSEQSYHEVMNTNLTGPFFLTQKCAGEMVKEKQKDADYEAMIVTISSVSATMASVERAEYCISKAGLAMLSKLYACRLAEYDIPVYEVRPGIIKTDMTAGVAEKYDALFADGLGLTSRWGTPEDVGRLVAALVRGDFCYSTGQVFMVDGGMTVSQL